VRREIRRTPVAGVAVCGGRVMETAIAVFSIIWSLVVLLSIYRMWKVHKFRIALMKENLDKYARLPSYAEMVFKFWRPFSHFSGSTPGHTPEQE
jgi:hypothetical protein